MGSYCTQNVEVIHYELLKKNFKLCILSPTVHICVCSAHATFTGVPLPQRSLSRGQTWWDKCLESPSGNAINDIHNHQGAKQLEVKVDIELILMQDLP